ncbi:MAG TPA: SEC-C metal-binding domain-containing protein [Vulgatibacter sp.]
METLGMQEGEPIEHKWLTRSIASAQKRVEAHHFDSRKNVLEYDDVMNQQRKTVYRMRREVLACGAGQPLVEFDEDPKTKKKTRVEKVFTWDDQKERMLDFFDEVVANLVDTYAPAKGEWDADALSATVKDQFGFEFTVSTGSREQLEDQLFEAFEKHWKAKEENLGLDADGVAVLRKFEQWISLQAIDAHWKDHLLQMDHLRQGIGLRGYGQKDPKAEYKKEGFEYFRQMAYRVREQVSREVLRLQVVTREQQEAQQAAARAAAELERKVAEQRRRQRVIESHADVASTANADRVGGGAASQRPVTRSEPKVGRNDPCPCGSGRTYKKCHGADAGAPTGT